MGPTGEPMEERVRILEMLRAGKLSVEEADRLLSALQPEKSASAPPGRLLRVLYRGHRGEKMAFALPLSLVDVVLRFLPKDLRVVLNGQEVEVARLLGELQQTGAVGRILDARDTRGQQIEIIIE